MEYVLVYAEHVDPILEVVFVEKLKPDWQYMRYNLPGGKIEEGETPIQAAERELAEETGLAAFGSQVMGKIKFEGGCVHCVFCQVNGYTPLKPRAEEKERVFWSGWWKIRNDLKLIPNLQVIVPLMHQGVSNWEIEDFAGSRGGVSHEILVKLNMKEDNGNS